MAPPRPLLLLLTLLIILAAPAFAGHCRYFLKNWRCGGIINNSQYRIAYTEYPDIPRSANGAVTQWRCKYWNWSPGAKDSEKWCIQRQLNPGQRIGGGGQRQTADVDAFTVMDSDYVFVRSMQSWPVKKGVWTKITDLDNIECTGNKGKGLIAQCSDRATS